MLFRRLCGIAVSALDVPLRWLWVTFTPFGRGSISVHTGNHGYVISKFLFWLLSHDADLQVIF